MHRPSLSWKDPSMHPQSTTATDIPAVQLPSPVKLQMPLTRELLTQTAEKFDVCTRPLAFRRTDLSTGQTDIVEVPCGATQADKCKPCAERHRRDRQQQIRDGWHLSTEPVRPTAATPAEAEAKMLARIELVFQRGQLERTVTDPAALVDQVRAVDKQIEPAVAPSACPPRSCSCSGYTGPNRTA